MLVKLSIAKLSSVVITVMKERSTRAQGAKRSAATLSRKVDEQSEMDIRRKGTFLILVQLGSIRFNWFNQVKPLPESTTNQSCVPST